MRVIDEVTHERAALPLRPAPYGAVDTEVRGPDLVSMDPQHSFERVEGVLVVGLCVSPILFMDSDS